MPYSIVRNDITKMNTEAIVNTANENPTVGTGCDYSIYTAAGYDELLKYREEKIGYVKEGDAFITPGFNLKAKYIIHAVSPRYNEDGSSEELLRSCYKNSLALAKENNIKSISFPLISTGGFGYPKVEGLRIALDEISSFLIENDLEVYIVVFDEESTSLSEKITSKLKQFISQNYVEKKFDEEYNSVISDSMMGMAAAASMPRESKVKDKSRFNFNSPRLFASRMAKECDSEAEIRASEPVHYERYLDESYDEECEFTDDGYGLDYSEKLEARLSHLSDTFSQYLMFLINEKGMKGPEVYNSACIDKRTFSKIKKNINYHPDKSTALRLCVGARLNIDQTKDLLARAGYALSSADMTDVIFEFFIENEIYDVVELDISLEEHGLPCFIS